MVLLSHHEPTEYSDFIERILTVDAQDVDFNLMLIPTHYNMLYLPLSSKGYLYDGQYYNKPILQTVLVTTKYIRIPAGSKILGVRFFPFGAYPFHTFEMNQIKEGLIEFDFDEKIDSAIGNVSTDRGIESVYKLLKKSYTPKRGKKIQLLKDFYYYLLDSNENTSINAFCELKNISYMTMYRVFKQINGISPKKIERLIKFRKSIDYMVNSKDKLTKIGTDSGYYDQSHFIKEFYYFVGMSPSDYIAHLKKEKLYDFTDFTKLSSC